MCLNKQAYEIFYHRLTKIIPAAKEILAGTCPPVDGSLDYSFRLANGKEKVFKVPLQDLLEEVPEEEGK